MLATIPALTAQAAGENDGARIRGITISTHLSGQDWAWDGMAPALRSVREIGANWVTIHPTPASPATGACVSVRSIRTTC